MKRYMFTICLGALLASCSARRMPATEVKEEVKPEAVMGRDKYMQYCQKCHPMGESGLGPALNNNPAPGFIKRFQVRHGLGAMPAFKADVISRADLNHIMKYLKTMKRRTPQPS
ncbi:cytochrome c [Chitinophaga sp.]|uniref:c-type cytochrome n=1 Tax=Chitinophaga sp. TaxID=1869181 RepID=UPI0031D19985